MPKLKQRYYKQLHVSFQFTISIAFANLLLIESRPGSADSMATRNLCQVAGPYGKMRALLQKTLFQVDVLTVDLCVDEATQDKLKNLVQERPYSAKLAQSVTEAILHAPAAFVLVRLKRDVSVDRFIEGIMENLKKAYESGLISVSNYQHVSHNLPKWFGLLKDRGFKEGDQLSYQVEKNSLLTQLITVDGRELLSQRDHGPEPRRALLAGYLAPGSDLQKLIIQSLFKDDEKATS